MASRQPKLEPADPGSGLKSIPIDGEAPPVQVLFYLYNEVRTMTDPCHI